jgi:hypothetical protein
MKPLKIGMAVLRPLILGMLFGGLVTGWWLAERAKQREAAQRLAEQQRAGQKVWPPRELLAPCAWSYVKVDNSGWSTGPVGSFENLDDRLGRPSPSGNEILIPIFPTVYTPLMVDEPYYDAILKSGIKPGDKVLVIGTGSGADAWVASLKSKAPVYVVEVNPLAVANARMTARLAGFQIKPVLGDMTKVALPDDFRDFDFVLWNMPFMWKPARIEEVSFKNNSFHDGDDGSLLKAFMPMLPSFLKKGGTAVLLNSPLAKDLIAPYGVMTKSNQVCALFVVHNQ